MFLDEFAEAFVVFLFHVDELDAAAVGADVADDGGEVDFVEGGAEAGGFDEGEALAFGGELAKQFDGFRGAKTAESFDSFDANENVAEGFVFAGGDFHEEGNGGGLLADANLIDHHWHYKRMGLGENRGEDERGALRRRRVGRASKFADGKILKIPFPTGHRASETAQEAIWIGGGEQFDGGADALAAGFEEPGFEKRENGDADGAKETGHGGNHVGAARVS